MKNTAPLGKVQRLRMLQ